MPWYSYIFFALAAIAILFGAHRSAAARNGAGVFYAFIVATIWFSLGMWTGGYLN